ncbi:winged helix DNA-binding protein [Clostridium saudiense]|uniref:Winged helix DNA-binding protein n=1 Tax=Clostridium saudiense TaxID=1414720 RepID=A0ABS2FEB4_9CLOT|nr:MarR family transcriptional regulator [Clostridium saudiense]MBM6818646.1 winged helix DNA-binding protein [Clostridium saudiense]
MINNLNLIDLISEKHISLRREVEERWSKSGDEEITHTEAMLLAKINMGKISIAEVARQANISRQAMHKCAKKLENRGYLKFISNENNQTYTILTEKGVSYCEKSNELKERIEKEIEDILGKENIKIIKNMLEKKWIK